MTIENENRLQNFMGYFDEVIFENNENLMEHAIKAYIELKNGLAKEAVQKLQALVESDEELKKLLNK